MENMKVFCVHHYDYYQFLIQKNFLVLDGFSSAVDRSWPSSKIAPVEKVYKWGENGFFRKP
jgi:hypothetical protein